MKEVPKWALLHQTVWHIYLLRATCRKALFSHPVYEIIGIKHSFDSGPTISRNELHLNFSLIKPNYRWFVNRPIFHSGVIGLDVDSNHVPVCIINYSVWFVMMVIFYSGPLWPLGVRVCQKGHLSCLVWRMDWWTVWLLQAFSHETYSVIVSQRLRWTLILSWI